MESAWVKKRKVFAVDSKPDCTVEIKKYVCNI